MLFIWVLRRHRSLFSGRTDADGVLDPHRHPSAGIYLWHVASIELVRFCSGWKRAAILFQLAMFYWIRYMTVSTSHCRVGSIQKLGVIMVFKVKAVMKLFTTSSP